MPEIASITGHTLKSVLGIMEKYMARTGALASAAIEKFENATSTNFANRLHNKDYKQAVSFAKPLK